MFVQINENKDLVAWGAYEFTGCTKEVEIDYTDYNENVDKYVYDKETETISENPEWPLIELNRLKQSKMLENDKKRDTRLASGVLFNGVLFDCDTDQKINLSSQLAFMKEGDTVKWYGMNNDCVELTTNDIISLGLVIKDLTEMIWAKNADIKARINNATSKEELEQIIINYEEVL